MNQKARFFLYIQSNDVGQCQILDQGNPWHLKPFFTTLLMHFCFWREGEYFKLFILSQWLLPEVDPNQFISDLILLGIG